MYVVLLVSVYLSICIDSYRAPNYILDPKGCKNDCENL